MKKFVFICLLSLSLCLSEPTSKPDAHPTQQAVNQETKTAPPKSEQASNPTHNETLTNATSPTHETEPAKPLETKDKNNSTTSIDNKTGNKEPEKKEEIKPTEKAPAKNDVKPEPAKEAIPAKETVPAKEGVPDKEGAPAGKDKNETSTVHPVPTNPTEEPKHVTEKPQVQARRFDGASFVGGMVLTLGLLAIGFMGFKYYKNQTERNYHTL